MAARALKSRVVKYLKNYKHTLEDIARHHNITPEEAERIVANLEDEGVQVDVTKQHKGRKLLYSIRLVPEIGNIYHISEAEKTAGQMRFVATSDWHFASKFFLPKSWHECMKRVQDAGFTKVYVAGDVLDGVKIYKGHHENLRAWSVEDQTDIVAAAIGQYPGLEFWGIAGNHDYSFTQQTGTKPLSILEQKVDNFKNLGDFRADVIYQGIRIRLLHGGGGRAYARSYPSQTYLRDYFAGLEKDEIKDAPHLMILGHFHTYYNGFDHGMYILQPGSFQDSDNEYCIRRGLTGPAGLWTVEMNHHAGHIDDFAATYVKARSAAKEKGRMHSKNTRNYRR